MTDKELKRLNRSELLQMLLTQMEENRALKSELEEARAQLSSRKILLDNAGSIAEASLKINGVFEAAQRAAQEYLDNLQDLQARQEAATEQILSEARQEAEAARAAADEYSQTTRAQVDAYWDRVFDKAQALLTAQDNLREVVEAGKDTEAV